MAKPIDLGLVLEGEDARRFKQYMNNPDDITPEGRQLLIEARELAKTMDLNGFKEANKNQRRNFIPMYLDLLKASQK